MTVSRASFPATAVTVCVAVFSVVTGFLAGTAAFSGRLATVETEYRQVQNDIHDMRLDMRQIADKVGAARTTAGTTIPAQTFHPLSRTLLVWASGFPLHYLRQEAHSGN